LEYFGSLYGVSAIEIKKKSHEILDMLQLSLKSDSRAGTLSGGMKTRLNIACALVHKPAMLILDEPSVGLDPVSRKALWDTIRAVNAEGTTILITTHYMEEADLLCDRILIMNRGKIVIEGTSRELKSKVGERIIRISSVPGDYLGIKNKIGSLGGILSCDIDEKGIRISLRDNVSFAQILEMFVSSGEKIENIESTSPSLEDVFIKASGEAWH
ncbi:MAG TPA: ATP-binding cassette domain-containing protein, partial [Candidatus Methanoperedens sp.]